MNLSIESARGNLRRVWVYMKYRKKVVDGLHINHRSVLSLVYLVTEMRIDHEI